MSDLSVSVAFKIPGSVPQQSAVYTAIRRYLLTLEAEETIMGVEMSPPTTADKNGPLGAIRE